MASRRALIIVNSEYAYDWKYPQLSGSFVNGQAIQAALSQYCGFAVEDCPIIYDGTVAEIRRAIQNLYAPTDQGDLTLLYYSGFCDFSTDSADVYLTAHDTHNDLASTAISAYSIRKKISASDASQHIIVLDCRYSSSSYIQNPGAYLAAFVPLDSPDHSIRIMASLLPYHPGGLAAGTLTFTSALANGITTGEASPYSNGQIGFGDWYNYARSQMANNTPQPLPVAWNNGAPDDPLLVHPRWVPVVEGENQSGEGGGSAGGVIAGIAIMAILMLLFFSLIGGSRNSSRPSTRTSGSAQVIQPAVAVGGEPAGMSAEAFVLAYYELLNRRQYEQAWNMLSPDYKQAKGDGFTLQTYSNLWDTIAEIRVERLAQVYENDAQAVFQGRFVYRTTTGIEGADDPYCLRVVRIANSTNWYITQDWIAQDCLAVP